MAMNIENRSGTMISDDERISVNSIATPVTINMPSRSPALSVFIFIQPVCV
jgi:hypothetical protein